MAPGRRRIAAVPVAVLVLTTACSGGDGDRETSPKREPTTSTTGNPPPTSVPPEMPDLAQMAETITRQLEQATTGPDGKPKPVDPEEVSALLKAQMEQYLNQTQGSGTGEGK